MKAQVLCLSTFAYLERIEEEHARRSRATPLSLSVCQRRYNTPAYLQFLRSQQSETARWVSERTRERERHVDYSSSAVCISSVHAFMGRICILCVRDVSLSRRVLKLFPAFVCPGRKRSLVMDIHRGDSLFPPNGHLFLRTRRYFFFHVWIINRDEFFLSFHARPLVLGSLFARRIRREQYGVRTSAWSLSNDTWDITCVIRSIIHQPRFPPSFFSIRFHRRGLCHLSSEIWLE